MSEANKRTVLRFIAAMSEGDAATAAECLAPGALAVTKGFSKLTGTCDRDTIVTLVGAMRRLVPSGLGLTVSAAIAEGDRVAVEFEGNAVTAAGTTYANQYCMVFTMVGERIVRTHEYFCTKLAEEVLWPVIEGANLASEAGGG
jgi:ketosteroid isomerase-like protein